MHVHTSRDSGRIVPRVTMAEGNYIAGCLRLLTLNPFTTEARF